MVQPPSRINNSEFSKPPLLKKLTPEEIMKRMVFLSAENVEECDGFSNKFVI